MFFSENDVLLQMAKQTAFGALAASPNGIVIPIVKGSQGPDHTRNKIENDARYADGFQREFALGNHQSGVDLPLVANLDFFGYPLHGLFGGLTDTGVVVAATVTAGGSGYVSPTASFSGGGGSGAAATVQSSGGVITGITITNRGSGYTSAPTITISGSPGTGATATAIIGQSHSGKPQKTVIPYSVEEAIGTNYYQYLDQVFAEMKVDFDIEGMFKPQFSTKGSGLFAKAVSSMDSTPTEVAGGPAEMLNWSTLEGGADSGTVTKCSLTVTREVLEARPSGKSGVASELVYGNTMVKATLSALFKDDVRWSDARNGVKLAFESTIVRGNNKFYFKLPELKFVPKTPKKSSGQLVYCEFEGDGIFGVDAQSPIYVDLTNTITTHSN